MRTRLQNLFCEEFAQTTSGLAKELNPQGQLPTDVRANLMKVSSEALNALALLKKAYIDRKNLLLKISNSHDQKDDPTKVKEVKDKITEMVADIDKRIQSFDQDLQTIKNEMDIVKNNNL